MKTFKEYIEDMLLYKESIGYSRKSYEYDLMRFCNYIVTKQLDVSDLKEEIVLSWCSRWESESQTSSRRRIQSVRELLKYLSAIGIDCYVIPSSFLPRPETRRPYIFTDKELQSIFKECDDLLPNKCSPKRHLILPVLLRLIFFCGLRPNEGRELQSCDIDFDKGIFCLSEKTNLTKSVMSPCPMTCCRCAMVIILPMPTFSLATHTFSHLRTAYHTIDTGFPDIFE